jgi:lipopolysaccharide export system ATP-binding protein
MSHGSRRVLDGLDLRVEPGTVVGLLGPNGAGKTTSIRIIAGFETPQRGRVTLGARSLDGLRADRRARLGLGYLPQEPSIFPDLSVHDNLVVVLEALGVPVSRAPEVLERMQISHLSAQKAGSLSGGERRRLEVARLDALDPAVWLLDEPFTGMDPMSIERISELIRSLRRRGKAILVSDHNVGQTLGLCDFAVLLDAGSTLVEGTPDEVARSPIAKERYLGEGFCVVTTNPS